MNRRNVDKEKLKAAPKSNTASTAKTADEKLGFPKVPITEL